MRYLLTCLSCCLLYSAGAQSSNYWGRTDPQTGLHHYFAAGRNKSEAITTARSPEPVTRSPLEIRVAALEKTVDSLRWKVRYTEWMADQAYQHLTMPMRLNEDDSTRISKIVWWKVMSMFYPGDGMYVAASDKISYGWMYTWLPRRLKRRFEKAMRLGKYHRQ